ncbi:MAG: hypothetical protein M0037_00095 [Betaproteobacteria bacterium]|nr:hypothetical protein [Betaproteobacteria bacterium]
MLMRKDLERLSDALTQARRGTPPPAGEAAQWVLVHDMDTNRPHWYPADLYRAWHEARFPSSAGHGD